jgi:hypothetical protein
MSHGVKFNPYCRSSLGGEINTNMAVSLKKIFINFSFSFCPAIELNFAEILTVVKCRVFGTGQIQNCLLCGSKLAMDLN